MKKVLKQLRADLEQLATPEVAKASQAWYKQPVKFRGIKTPVVRKLARQYWKEINSLDKQDILAMGEVLMASGYGEDATVAIQWAKSLRPRLVKNDFKVFEQWLSKYCDTWSKVDDLCLSILSYYVYNYPEVIPKLKPWLKSTNLYVRRAGAVAFIRTNQIGNYAMNKKVYLPHIFRIAEILKYDSEDLVQKAYGWLLKAASVEYPDEVYEFILKHKHDMPRTALRYALEKYSINERKEAMLK